MPTPFLWNQSHTGLVDVNENSLSLWRIHALQEIAPAPQPLRLIKLQTDAKKTNLFEKTAAVFWALSMMCVVHAASKLRPIIGRVLLETLQPEFVRG